MNFVRLASELIGVFAPPQNPILDLMVFKTLDDSKELRYQ